MLSSWDAQRLRAESIVWRAQHIPLYAPPPRAGPSWWIPAGCSLDRTGWSDEDHTRRLKSLFHLSSTRTTPHLTRKQRTYGGFVCSPSTRAAEMWSCITDFFTYETTKSVVVKSWTIGIINRIVQLIIITYFIGWVFQALPVILH